MLESVYAHGNWGNKHISHLGVCQNSWPNLVCQRHRGKEGKYTPNQWQLNTTCWSRLLTEVMPIHETGEPVNVT